MARSSLFGRRIHITGSIAADAIAATTEEVARAREVVEVLVKDLLRKELALSFLLTPRRLVQMACPSASTG